MKELFQAVDIEKCIPLFKKGMASLIICSMLMIDVAKAMDDQDDPRLLKVVQRTPSPKPPAPDLRSMGSPSPEQSSSDGDSSPRSVSPPSSLPAPARDIIGSKPSSDDSASSGSSPEQSPPNGNQSLQIIPFPDLSQSSRQNITSPSSSSRESQPEDFGTTPGAASFPDRVPALHVSSEKDRLLGSRTSSYGSSNSSGSSDHSSDSSSDSSGSSSDFEGDVEEGDPQSESRKTSSSDGLQGTIERFIERFASTKSSQSSPDQKGTLSSRLKSTPNAIHESAEALENVGGVPLLIPGHPSNHSIQSYGPGDDELSVDVDLVGDEDALLPSQPGFFSRHFGRPFWPERPEYTLAPGALDRAAQFFAPLRSRHAPESHPNVSEGERSTSSSDASPQHSPTFPRYAAAPPPDSDSEGDGQTVTLLPPDHLHRTMNYSSLRGLFHPSGVSGTLHQGHDEEFDPTAVPYPGSLSTQTPWALLLDDIKGLSPKIKAQLTDFTHQILNGKSTWAQRLGKWLIGPLIGAGFAYGMAPVYDGGLTYLASIDEAFNEFLKGNGSNYLIVYIMYSALPDSISRNAHLWKKGIAYLFREKKEVGRMCIASAIAAVTALFPLAYLILAENIGRERFQFPNWDNVFGLAVVVRGIPLLIDAFANEFYITWNSISKLEDWCRQFRQVFFPSFLPPQIRSPEAIQREKFNHNLVKLERFLGEASSAVIEAIYTDVQDIIAGARSEVDLPAQKAFSAASYLLSLGDEVQEVAKKNAKKSIAEIAFDGLKYTCLILGAPTVGLLLQLVGSTVASLFTSSMVADSIGEGFALIAFLPFNYVLAQSMENFKNLVMSKDPQGYESHPAIRLPVKVFIGIQSLLYLFQTSVAVLQSYQKWFGDQWWPFAAGIPFFIPKLMGLAYNFNGTFNEQVTTSAINGCHRIGGRCREDSLCSPCQKDWLIRFIESSRNGLEYWSPELIQNLTKGLEIFKNEEDNLSFDEI